jgi:hypothetical protein
LDGQRQARDWREPKTGEKQKRRPKIKDKKQSERFKEAARALGVDEDTATLERVFEKLVPPKKPRSRPAD